MNSYPPNVSTHWRPCVDGICYCDWRLTITNCYDEKLLRYINIVILALTVPVIIIGIGLLYHRLVNLKQVIFEYRNNFLRPRAMESILFFMVLHNILRLVQAISVVTDTAQNIIFRQFIFEFSFEMGYTTLGVYLFGIVHALRESDRVIFDQWMYSPLFADILCTSIIVSPYITNTICSLGAGISGYMGLMDQANAFTQALYTVWTAHCVVICSLTILAAYRLLNILNAHIKRKEETNTNIDVSKVKLGASKVKIIASTSSICMFLYSGVAITYGTLRVQIITHVPYNIFLFIAWNGLSLLASSLIAFSVILNPRMKLSLLFTSDTSGATRTRGMELDSSQRNTSTCSSNQLHNTKKHAEFTSTHDNMTSTNNGTCVDSAYDTYTFDNDTIGNEEKTMYVDSPGRNYTSMDAAPTLSTAIAMQYSNRSNPLVLDDNDVELIHAYPESTKSCSHLVEDKTAYGY
ncbi:hypothetical protein BC941DRAFT_428999 [Chlamydoabsidia padenii]|nr:hypothetical protein BC941DRAFT_428999 [Chlamydoabsidia padenii]